MDYEKTYEMLVKELRKTDVKGVRTLTRRLYLIILLTQLRNGIKLGEAIDFVEEAARELKREGTVIVRGRPKRVVLPEEVSRADLLMIHGVLEQKLKSGRGKLIQSIVEWVQKTYGLTTRELAKGVEVYLFEKFGIEKRGIRTSRRP